MSVKAIILTIVTDRAVQVGTGGTGAGVLGALTAPDIQAVAATFAACMAGFASLVTAVYVCIRIKRLLKHPDKTE